MIRRVSGAWFAFCWLVVAVPTCLNAGDPTEELLDDLFRLTEIAQQSHVQAPVRQQMMLAAMRSLAEAVGTPLSASQTQRFSECSADELRNLTKEIMVGFRKPANAKVSFRQIAVPALLHSLPGRVQLITDEDLEVQRGSDRFLSNTYVGIGIALTYDQQRQLSAVGEVIESGPGYTAGLLAGDLIEAVDGKDVQGVPLGKLIRMLRGPEDSTLELVVRQPDAKQSRRVEIVRKIVPRELISQYRVLDDHIAYLKVDQIAASTVHELRGFEYRARRDGCRALVLDLRGTRQSELHYCVTLGDALLDDEPIGQRWTTSGVKQFDAQPESLFQRWPLAILVDRDSSDHASWLAACLRASRRAHILGFDASRRCFDHEPVAVPDRSLSIVMATGRLIPAQPNRNRPEKSTVPLAAIADRESEELIQLAADSIRQEA